MPPWLIVTGGWPTGLAAATSAVAKAGSHRLGLALLAVAVVVVALTLGCGSLLRRRRHRRARRAAVG